MEQAQVTSVAVRYHTLRGLLLVPTGVLFIAAGLFNMPPIGDEPVSGYAWYFAAVLVLAGVAFVWVNHYYVTRFGRVDQSRRTKTKIAAFTVLCAVAIGVAITLDTQFDLPVSLYGLAYGLALLGYYHVFVGLRPHHWAFLGGLAALCALPVWGGIDDTVSVTLVPMGVATIAIGLYDHRDLVTSMRRVRSVATDGQVDAHVS
jgi:uncharacterized membrane protein YiaA